MASTERQVILKWQERGWSGLTASAPWMWPTTRRWCWTTRMFDGPVRPAHEHHWKTGVARNAAVRRRAESAQKQRQMQNPPPGATPVAPEHGGTHQLWRRDFDSERECLLLRLRQRNLRCTHCSYCHVWSVGFKPKAECLTSDEPCRIMSH